MVAVVIIAVAAVLVVRSSDGRTGGGLGGLVRRGDSVPPPSRESIPFPEPADLNSVREEVDPIPSATAKRYRITDPKSGISFAPVVKLDRAGHAVCLGSNRSTCTYERQEWHANLSDAYGEWVDLLPIHPGDTEESVLREDFPATTPMTGFGPLRRVTIDGHPGVEALHVFESYEQTQVVATVDVVRTKAGYLRIKSFMYRKRGDPAAPKDPFLATFRIPD